MSVVGNILWVILGGFLVFVEYILGGIALCLTIIGIPFGIQCFKLAVLALWPFGREVRTRPRGMGALAVVMNVVWIILFGLATALTHVVLALFFTVTIVGLPFAVQHMKLARLAFTPFDLYVAEPRWA